MTDQLITNSDDRDLGRMKAILVLTAAVAFVTSPFWSSGFNGFEADQFPVPQTNPPAQPAGYAFSIWGVIYLWLFAMAVFGLFARGDNAAWDRPRWALIATLAVGASWLPIAQISPVWATVLIWIMLAFALRAMFLASATDRWVGRYAIELYAGWLTAASCVSLALLGAGYGVAFGAVGWAFVAISVALLIAGAVLWMRFAPFYAVGVVWALVGVIVRNFDTTLSVAIFAAIGIAVIVGLVVRSTKAQAA